MTKLDTPAGIKAWCEAEAEHYDSLLFHERAKALRDLAARITVPEVDREALGREARAAYTSDVPHWTAWDEMRDEDREAYRRIGERIFALGAESAAERVRELTETIESMMAASREPLTTRQIGTGEWICGRYEPTPETGPWIPHGAGPTEQIARAMAEERLAARPREDTRGQLLAAIRNATASREVTLQDVADENESALGETMAAQMALYRLIVSSGDKSLDRAFVRFIVALDNDDRTLLAAAEAHFGESFRGTGK